MYAYAFSATDCSGLYRRIMLQTLTLRLSASPVDRVSSGSGFKAQTPLLRFVWAYILCKIVHDLPRLHHDTIIITCVYQLSFHKPSILGQ